MAEVKRATSTDVAPAIECGIIGGIIAGVIFAMSEMVMAVLLGTPAVAPLQMIGAIALGPGVLPPAAPTASTLLAGVVVHMILSAIYGVVLALIALAIPVLRSSVRVLTGIGMVWGLVLWLVNFYLIAPVAFPWFGMANPVVQFIAHVFFFGAVLGYVLGTKLARPGPASPETRRPSAG